MAFSIELGTRSILFISLSPKSTQVGDLIKQSNTVTQTLNP